MVAQPLVLVTGSSGDLGAALVERLFLELAVETVWQRQVSRIASCVTLNTRPATIRGETG
jgi:NAD(P)-dependent dehydrogenase (short-subunit alcohol dehydrogenase family)